MPPLTRAQRSAIWATGVACIGAAVSAPAVVAAPIPSHIKIVGSSCDKPLQVYWDAKGGDGRPFAAHPYDDHWLHLSAAQSQTAEGKRRVDLRWNLSSEVELCDDGWTRLGWGNQEPITTRSGSRSAELLPDRPAKAKLNARFVRPPTAVRDGLNKRRLKTMIAGWARRGCALLNSNPGAAMLLEDLATRAGAHDCRPPKRVRPSAMELLHHLVAYFNAARQSGGAQLGREYYRVLAQFTTR